MNRNVLDMKVLEETRETVVTISIDYFDYLERRESWLNCLEQAGVDDWEGIDFAYEIRENVRLWKAQTNTLDAVVIR